MSILAEAFSMGLAKTVCGQIIAVATRQRRLLFDDVMLAWK
jgi:hypothetical protein